MDSQRLVDQGPEGVKKAKAWEPLLKYHYPGNVRQLQHVIQRAVAVGKRGNAGMHALQIIFTALPSKLFTDQGLPRLAS